MSASAWPPAAGAWIPASFPSGGRGKAEAAPTTAAVVDPAWQATKNVLVVRLDNMGDVLMTTPAINAVRGTGGRRVTLLASPAGAALKHHVPSLDDVLVHEAPWVKGPLHGTAADRQFLDELAGRRFDGAVICTTCTQSALPAALLCHLAGIPLRLAHSRENAYGLLTHAVAETDAIASGMRHEVARQLDLVRSVGFDTADTRLTFACSAADTAAARRKLRDAGGDPLRPYVVVHPGSTAPSRRYPPERFGQAALAIAERTGAQIVFTSGPGELDAAAAAQQAMRSSGGPPGVALGGALTLGELAALIGGAAAMLCNNSGPTHLAAAMQTPVVVLYALTNPQHTPWQVPARVLNHDVPCRHCLKSVCPEAHHACLLGVTPQAAADAVVGLVRQPLQHRPAAPDVGRFTQQRIAFGPRRDAVPG